MTDWDDETHVTEDGEVPRPIDEPRNPALVVMTGTALGQVFPLRPGSSVIGRTAETDIAIPDEAVSRAHARIYVEGATVSIEDLGSRNGTFVNGLGLDGVTDLDDGDRIQLGHGTTVRFAYLDPLDERFQQHLHESAIRDGLTRLYNKRYLRERLVSEVRFAVRHRADLALLLLDLDHFKRTNDTFGHLAGDRVLVATAEVLGRTLRAEDVLARYGGEELAVLLRGIALPGAQQTAERLRAVVEALDVRSDDGRPIPVTVSIGVATLASAGTAMVDELIGAADRSLYAAKRAGRNRVGE